jgi:hypothetical protein
VDAPNGGSWQVNNIDPQDSCNLITYAQSTPAHSSSAQLLPPSPPPAVIMSLASDSSSTSMAASDNGLESPQITELLPNPAAPTKDADGEFIEIYNSNNTSFDLGNFVLQTGLETKHKYTFPNGFKLKANSFTAFKLKGTGLSLSNSEGQASLLDPASKTVSQSEVYDTAKDGSAWALANGRWYWTNKPTPSAANVVDQAVLSPDSTAGPQVLGSADVSTDDNSSASGNPDAASTEPSSVHGWTLAGVGGAALLYACYEYRTDLANHLYRFRRYLAARRAAGK